MFKKQILKEIYILILAFFISIFINVFIFNTNIFVKETALILIGTFIKFLYLIGVTLLLYFLINLLRQFKLKYKKIVSNIFLFITSVMLIFLIYFVIQFISSDTFVLNESQATIYPPLSAIPQSSQNDMNKINIFINILWSIIFLLVIVAITTIFLTYKNRKRM